MNRESNKPVPQLTGNWAIFGGAFDPIHRGHTTLALDILTTKQLTGVLFVPSFKPLLKLSTCKASFEDRIAMVRLAIEPYHAFKLSTIESEMGQPGYTLNTVRALKRMYPQVQFHFLIGADLLSEIGDWHQPEEILSEVPLIVGSRPTDKNGADRKPYGSDRIEYVETSLVDVSSSMIRDRIKVGIPLEELNGFVADDVALYIIRGKLYQ